MILMEDILVKMDCGCNTAFKCPNHRFEGRTGNSADSDLMAQNDDIGEYLAFKAPKQENKISPR